MKLQQGFEQCYNAQAVVEEGRQLIVAQQVGQNAADHGVLLELVDEVERNTGSKPQRVLADAGYRSEENFAGLEGRQIEGLVALGREGRARRSEQPKVAGAATARMRRRLAEPRGQQYYARRKGLVEPVFGWLKARLGFRQFSLRGLRKVQGEWSLVTLALNLRRMAGMVPLATVG